MTQQRIVDVLRGRGCKVLSLAAMGNGCADLLVLLPWKFQDISDEVGPVFRLIEVKNLDGRGKKLTPDQVKFHAEWPVTVVTNAEEALRAVGL
jgi:hypothetical protein